MDIIFCLLTSTLQLGMPAVKSRIRCTNSSLVMEASSFSFKEMEPPEPLPIMLARPEPPPTDME